MKKIKYLVMDVDGTLTDGNIYIGNEGEVFKAFSCKDGYGIRNIAIPNHIIPVIITGRQSKIVENRCNELGIQEIYQKIHNKEEVLNKILEKNQDNFSNVAYIGDDLNDMTCMLQVKKNGGIVGCPADAVKEVVQIADYISKKAGGKGAVRDFIEWIVDQEL